ncbi:hypothetical protein [Leadbetterella byssophila]|uniref:hypothetical protein n=1 Tax=Leadbetterella byssophila TaxID=316068 RepID=UPI0039A1524F
MKNTLLQLSILLCTLSAWAQNSTYRGDEFYATVQSLRDLDFGFAYKYGFNNSTYLRFDLLNASYSKRKLENFSMIDPNGTLLNVSEQVQSNYDLGIGIEKRKDFNEHMQFLYGVSAIAGRSGQTTEAITADDKVLTEIINTTWRYGAGLNLGILVRIVENLHLGAELIPKYMISTEKTEYIASAVISNQVQKAKQQDFYLSMNDVRFSLVYRFKR